MKLRVWKSLTFFIGLILFIAAFGVILVAGSIFNPPPYRITIALKEIPPYTLITRDMLAVDEQTMHQRVASRLVHETEIDRYLGGMAIETIHAGEPLRRNAVVTADNPAAVHRLSLALTDPDLVAAVVPVDSKIIPDNVTAGDYVNVTVGIEGNVSQLTAATWGEAAGSTAWGAPPASTPTPTPVPFTATLPLTPTGPLPLSDDVPEVAPPLDKIVLPQVQVIHVAREKVPNPNYGMTFGQEGAQEPPFLDGNIESITLLVPKAAEELLYFAVDNGTLHISIVPHLAVIAGASPSTGVLWEDIVRFFQEERLSALSPRALYSDRTGLSASGPRALYSERTGLSALGVITTTAPSSVSTVPVTASEVPTAPVVSLPQLTPTPAEAAVVPSTPLPPSGEGEPVPGDESSLPATLASSLSGYLVPLCIGGGLAIGLGAVAFALMRRRKGS
jgi:hypothetical protein